MARLAAGIALSRFLGPLAIWRVIQASGEAGGDVEGEEVPVECGADIGLTRGQFLKGMRDAAVTMGVLSGPDRLAAPTRAQSVALDARPTDDAVVGFGDAFAGWLIEREPCTLDRTCDLTSREPQLGSLQGASS